MREKVSFFFLNRQGSASHQFVTSQKALKILFLVFTGILVVGLVSAGYITYNYRKLQKTVAEMEAMEDCIVSQQDEIINQREEIQAFAETINVLKDELFALKVYEARVREIADIKDTEKADKKGSQGEKKNIGMGGPLPEDINTDIDLKKKHGQLIDEMHQHADQLRLTSIQQSDEIKDLLKELLEKQKRADCTPSIRPAKGRTTSKFGYRRSAFNNKREYHKGYDIGAPKGSPIVATADGIVKFVGRNGSFGKMVVIDHGYGYTTRYAHASKLVKKKGEQVKKGDVIALVGNTGRSTGPHVHYEVLKKGVPVNPQKYFLN
ncbi:MAG: peptidoglycan DD-metalloendopeptidase family protein [Thermodesulfobacteriota bacterium]|nr:peptidoglycan DD-metalloendopeptidase family protein [Thermodesulfobacteriota bacterium]